MPDSKSEKELAFLHDLFIAPDWGERFAELIDEHATLPARGNALYLACGTGAHALAVQERAGIELKFLCIDESEERLELARAKAATTKAPAEFRRGVLEKLDSPDEQFDLVIGDASLVAPERVPAMLAEMTRVAAVGATVAIALPTASSFGEFFSLYWEALHNAGFVDHEAEVERLITSLPTIAGVEELAEREGLEGIATFMNIEEFDFESGEAFLSVPLIGDFLMKEWLCSIAADSQSAVLQAIAQLIDEERHDAEFSLSVKATLVVGRRINLPLVG